MTAIGLEDPVERKKIEKIVFHLSFHKFSNVFNKIIKWHLHISGSRHKLKQFFLFSLRINLNNSLFDVNQNDACMQIRHILISLHE